MCFIIRAKFAQTTFFDKAARCAQTFGPGMRLLVSVYLQVDINVIHRKMNWAVLVYFFHL